MKSEVMIIKNGLTGEQIRIPNVEMLDLKGKEAVIEAYTGKMIEDEIGYYISFMREMK